MTTTRDEPIEAKVTGYEAIMREKFMIKFRVLHNEMTAEADRLMEHDDPRIVDSFKPRDLVRNVVSQLLGKGV